MEVINLCVLYFVIKWGVKNGIKDYYYEKEEEEAEVKERNKKGEK